VTLALRLRPEAERDLADAAAWYQEQSPGLGHEFLEEILASFSTIEKTPRLYPVIHRKTRRALIRRFPFGIFYRIEPSAVVVVAVMHGSRNPRLWKSR
jgi:plasmid stabilization system protein ParE